ncbi:MAG: hypothetical protein CM15mP51_21440 [Porticoccaceae bacterium]|nr:MAG: hypothetical protein CM15mP51_21440 [Porticoccaceae bacterium]
MTEFLLVLFVFFSIIALMSIGVLLRKKPIVGSCGGVGAALGRAIIHVIFVEVTRQNVNLLAPVNLRL